MQELCSFTAWTVSYCEIYKQQLNTSPSIVLKVFHFLYFPSLVNKAATCKSECLKLDFQILLRLLNSSIQILRSESGYILEASRVFWNKFKNLA